MHPPHGVYACLVRSMTAGDAVDTRAMKASTSAPVIGESTVATGAAGGTTADGAGVAGGTAGRVGGRVNTGVPGSV